MSSDIHICRYIMTRAIMKHTTKDHMLKCFLTNFTINWIIWKVLFGCTRCFSKKYKIPLEINKMTIKANISTQKLGALSRPRTQINLFKYFTDIYGCYDRNTKAMCVTSTEMDIRCDWTDQTILKKPVDSYLSIV